jgi:EAL domain-containing protein (putative c-di-GMP-specific phosphodiesterase class I)
MNSNDFKHLFELKPDFIRIHGDFLNEVVTNEEIKEYMISIMNFAKKINIKTQVTHIETESQYNKALEYNFDLYQGIYLQAPTDKIH